MTSTDLLPTALLTAREEERRTVVPRIAQRALVILLAVMYGGGFLFLATISPLLLYGFYLATACLIAASVESLEQLTQHLKPVAPYLAWLMIFWCWGVLVSPYPGEVFGEVVRVLFRNMLFLLAVALVLAHARNYRFFSLLVQVAIFVNFVIVQRQLNDPQFAVDFARRLGEESYVANNVRPGGLWINPDEASFALLFGLLLTARDRGPLVWLARAAAVYMIYLTASRSGNYILALFFVVYMAFQLTRRVLSFRRAVALVNLVALLYVVGLGLYYTDSLPRYDVSQDFALSRILDVQESNTDYTRGDLTRAVYQLAVEAPWHGYGAMGLQDAQTSSLYFQSRLPGLGAHNIYLAVWGETGLLGLATYLGVIGLGVAQAIRKPLSPENRLIALLMWAGYLIRGLTWHSQFLSATGIVLAGVIFCYPFLAASAPADEPRATPEGAPTL